MDVSRYHFGRALRPFSFSVSLVCCSLGASLAWLGGSQQPLRIVLVLLAGLLLQAGVNLINDYSDLKLLPSNASAAGRLIRRNFRIGLGCFVLCGLLAVFLIQAVGWPLLLLCLLGLAGALGYTLEPLNYKRRGLGVLMVFWLMGVLMVTGACLAVAGHWSPDVVLMSLPVSLLTSLLLLSNELRDWESDSAQGMPTLTVRWGYRRSCRLYVVLIVLTYLSAFGLFLQGWLPQFLPLLLTLPLLPSLWRLLAASVQSRRRLPPASGRFFAAFGALYILCVINPF